MGHPLISKIDWLPKIPLWGMVTDGRRISYVGSIASVKAWWSISSHPKIAEQNRKRDGKHYQSPMLQVKLLGCMSSSGCHKLPVKRIALLLGDFILFFQYFGIVGWLASILKVGVETTNQTGIFGLDWTSQVCTCIQWPPVIERGVNRHMRKSLVNYKADDCLNGSEVLIVCIAWPLRSSVSEVAQTNTFDIFRWDNELHHTAHNNKPINLIMCRLYRPFTMKPRKHSL